jgi:hypothetical protein
MKASCHKSEGVTYLSIRTEDGIVYLDEVHMKQLYKMLAKLYAKEASQ